MKNIDDIRIIARKTHCIKPDVLQDYSPLLYAGLKPRTKFYVSEEWTPGNLIEFFDEILELPHLDEYGDRVTYILKRGDHEIDGSVTLREAGIREGDIIKIAPVSYKTGGELEIVEISDMVRHEIAPRPPDEILEQFNKIASKEITVYIEKVETEKGEETEKVRKQKTIVKKRMRKKRIKKHKNRKI